MKDIGSYCYRVFGISRCRSRETRVDATDSNGGFRFLESVALTNLPPKDNWNQGGFGICKLYDDLHQAEQKPLLGNPKYPSLCRQSVAKTIQHLETAFGE